MNKHDCVSVRTRVYFPQILINTEMEQETARLVVGAGHILLRDLTKLRPIRLGTGLNRYTQLHRLVTLE